MDFLAAHPRLALLGAIVVVVVVYRWHIMRHPWVNCGWCSGGGKARHLSLSPFGACGRCGGTGKRRRFAAILLGYDKTTGAKRR